MPMIDIQSLTIVMPEITLAVVAFVCLIAAAACGPRVTRHIGVLAIGAFALAGGVLFCPERLKHLLDGALPVFAFGTQFVDDSFGRFGKALILTAASLSVLLSWSYFEKTGDEKPEYPVLIMFATLGMMLMVSASDFISLYVGIELQSLALYVLAAFKRDDIRSSEAGLKYFTLGALSSGLLLYGISLIYGYTGTTDFVSVSIALRQHMLTNPGIVIGMVFVCAALSFKVSGVPFHMWAPDVYEGAPTPVAAFFASAPKIAALILFARFLLTPMHAMAGQWHQIIVFVALASMLWGAFAGLAQTNFKRLLAYSSIANIGFILVALSVGGREGLQSMLVYLAIYALNTLGAFAVLLCLRRDGKPVNDIADFAGLGKTNPGLALAMTVLMFSLAGVPPLAGFFAKYFVLLAAVDAGMLPVVVIGVLSSVVGAFYYLKIVKLIYVDEPQGAFDPLPDWGVRSVLALSALAMIGITLAPSPLLDATMKAARGFIG
ncbi:MAG: NADH-quinone oxidoreductase subunit NuoN [Alphaproteobacteria bacterium]|nr:NADH-quinone oxidoreductase subunit NuoN [Alphaproteobacteria bacterium]